MLIVEDDGPGIPPELQRRVFERFVRGGGDGGARLRPRPGDRPRGRRARTAARSTLGAPADGTGTRFVIRFRASAATPRGSTRDRARRSDLDDDRQHHRTAAQPVVDERGEVVVQLLLEEVDLADAVAAPRARASARPRRGSRATSSSACSMNGTPRKITSVSATGSPFCSEIVATTMKIPSADSIRRSRSATSAGSPMSTPSTKIIPDCSGSPKRGAALVDLERQAVLAAEHVVGVDPDRVGELARAGGSACGRRGPASRSAA